MRKRLAEPFRSVCQHPRPLAEREPDERGALLAVVVEDRVGDGDDPGAFRQGAAEGEAAGLAEGRMPVVKAVRAAKQFLTYVASGPFPYAVAEWEGLEGAAIGTVQVGRLVVAVDPADRLLEVDRSNRLPGGAGDGLEVVIVVQQCESCFFRGCGHEEVDSSGASVFTLGGELALDDAGSPVDAVGHGAPGELVQPFLDGLAVFRGTCGVEDFQFSEVAQGDQPGAHPLFPLFGCLTQQNASQGRRIDEVVGNAHRAGPPR